MSANMQPHKTESEQLELEGSPGQRAAISMALNNRISILTGGPGTGKTTAIRMILREVKARKLTCRLAAPTGKAANRMREATQMDATTIHSMLGCERDGNGFKFIHNKENQMNVDLVILDEVSMISLDLMTSTIEAINPHRTCLLLVGDQDQLPSVGPGAILRDLLKSGVIPHTELGEPFRNSGLIVEACHRIKVGKEYTPARKLALDETPPQNLLHIEQSTPQKTKKAILGLGSKVLPQKGFDPEHDIQVISPVNEMGDLSCKALNEGLRGILNPLPGEQEQFWYEQEEPTNDLNYMFRTGDKIINTVNTVYKRFGTKKEEAQVVNGDMGFVHCVGPKNLIVIFQAPTRVVVIPRSEALSLQHAYCITCHKFQGSEAPVIIIPVHRQFDMFLSNAWIYTAISRGSKVVITVGLFATIKKAIGNRTPNKRQTRLQEEITKAEDALLDI